MNKDRMMRSAHSDLSPEDQWGFNSQREKKGAQEMGKSCAKVHGVVREPDGGGNRTSLNLRFSTVNLCHTGLS